MGSPDVIVVGGGVVGCAAAYALARAGARVVVLERDAIAAHASSAAAGMLAPIAESLGRGPVFEIGVRALDTFGPWVQELRDVSGIDPLFVRSGLVRVRRKGQSPPDPLPAELRACGVEMWSDADVRSHLPGLGADVEGAFYSPREGHVDPLRLTRACAAAARRLGVRIETGVPVLAFETDAGERIVGLRTPQGTIHTRQVVWCTGAWASELPRAVGCEVPVTPVKGQMIALEPLVGPAPAPIVWDDAVYLVPRTDGVLRVGATVEHRRFDVTPTAGGLRGLLDASLALWPSLASARFVSTWAGLRPVSPDGLPIVGASRISGLWLAVGHGRNGILLSERTARWIVALLLGERDGVSTEERPWIDPDRFAAAG